MPPLTPTQILAAVVFLGSFAELAVRLVAVDLLLLRLHGRPGTISRAMDLLGTPAVVCVLGGLVGVIFYGLAQHFWGDPSGFSWRPVRFVLSANLAGLLAMLLVHRLGLY